MISLLYDSHSPSGAAKEMVIESEKEAHSTPVDTTHMSEDNTAYEAVTGMYICRYTSMNIYNS